MKTIVKYLLSTFLLLGIEVVSAQDKAGTRSELPSKISVKGRRELRKDKRIKSREKKSLEANKKEWKNDSDTPFIKREKEEK